MVGRSRGSLLAARSADVVGTGEYWGVRVKYRARNGFGGYITKNQLARIQDGRVVSLVDFP